MPDMMLIGLFAFLLFAPCALALLGSKLGDGRFADAVDGDFGVTQRVGVGSLDAMQPELELADKFVIRSFPKGLSQERLLVRDDESGVKLHIAQVRAAAVELIRLGGATLAWEMALTTAVLAAAFGSLTRAAQEVLEAARNAVHWSDRREANMREQTAASAWEDLRGEIAPGRIPPRRVEAYAWREATQAA